MIIHAASSIVEESLWYSTRTVWGITRGDDISREFARFQDLNILGYLRSTSCMSRTVSTSARATTATMTSSICSTTTAATRASTASAGESLLVCVAHCLLPQAIQLSIVHAIELGFG